MNRPPSPSPRPRIWAIGISKLRDLYRDIADEYDGRADLRLVSRGYEDAVNEIVAAGADRPDIVVAAGSNGMYLKARVNVPVVLVAPTGFDVMHALARARRDGSSVALVTHGETPGEVCRFVAAYGIDVVFASYESAQDAETCVLDLRDRGVETVVGPGLVTDLAARAGMAAVFLYSRASVRAAFDTALEVTQATWREAVRRQRLDSVLQHLRDGVVALDAQGHIEAINHRLAFTLGIDPANAAGKPLLELAPDIANAVPDAEGESLETVRGISYVVHRGPLVDNGVTTGTVLTFQESRAVERLDRTLRSRQRSQQFVARYRLDDLVGECAAIARVRRLVLRYAKSDATVLIRGESGTGKEMVAQSIHHASARRDFPFVAINCGAFPEALLESELFGYEEGGRDASRFDGGLRRGRVSRRSLLPAQHPEHCVAAAARAAAGHHAACRGTAAAGGAPRAAAGATHSRRERRVAGAGGRVRTVMPPRMARQRARTAERDRTDRGRTRGPRRGRAHARRLAADRTGNFRATATRGRFAHIAAAQPPRRGGRNPRGA